MGLEARECKHQVTYPTAICRSVRGEPLGGWSQRAVGCHLSRCPGFRRLPSLMLEPSRASALRPRWLALGDGAWGSCSSQQQVRLRGRRFVGNPTFITEQSEFFIWVTVNGPLGSEYRVVV